MAGRSSLTVSGFFLRLIFSALLVFLTYNPGGINFVHWVMQNPADINPYKVLAGLVLLAAWGFCLNVTMRSLGAFGMLITAGIFATLVWALFYAGFLDSGNLYLIQILVLAGISVVLAVGMSWSHIQRRISGQVDVEHLDEG